MSELTRCNFCDLETIVKPQAKKKGLIVTLISSSGAFSGSVDVYVHPANVVINKLSISDRRQYWKIWFMALPDHCTC